MAEFLALLKQILVAVLGNSDLTKRIISALGLTAQQSSVDLVLTDTDSIVDDLQSTMFGLAVLHDQLTDLATTLALVATGVGNIETQQAGWDTSGVPLPTTPPSGYGADTGGTADAVWNTDLSIWPNGTAGQNLYQTWAWSYVWQYQNLQPMAYNPLLWWQSPPVGGPDRQPSFSPEMDIANVLADDTALSFCLREAPELDWSISLWGSDHPSAQDPTILGIFYIFKPDAAEFLALKAAVIGSSTVGQPIWPGLANVTFGASVDISSQFTIVGPMDGVSVELDSVNVSKVALAYDTAIAYRNIGALSFYNDNGDQEAFQPLSFDTQNYVPFTMEHAAGVRFRVDPSVVGTVVPWVAV